jgi:hypothetical protein
MSAGEVLGFIRVFGAGLLAGEEFVIRYGVRGPLGRLDQESHIRMRQGLIRTLRILVPAILVPTLLSAVAVTVTDGADGAWRSAARPSSPCWPGPPSRSAARCRSTRRPWTGIRPRPRATGGRWSIDGRA